MIFLQQVIRARSNVQILQRATSDFTSSNKQRVNFNMQRATIEKLRLGIIRSLSLILDRIVLLNKFLKHGGLILITRQDP